MSSGTQSQNKPSSAMRMVKIRVTLYACLPQPMLNQYLPIEPDHIGEALALKIDAYSRQHRLGYYPALDFFQAESVHNKPAPVDPSLLDAEDSIAWLAENVLRDEIHSHLRGEFAQVELQQVRCLAFSMPTIRPQQSHAVAHLASHLTPVQFRTTLLLSRACAGTDAEQSNQEWSRYVRRQLLETLGKTFDVLKVTSVQVLDE